jgi:hypothetical protein
LRQPRACACDVSVSREAEALGARGVEIEDVESGDTYRAPLERFWPRDTRILRGHGEQRSLLLADFSKNGTPSRADAMQPSLFSAEMAHDAGRGPGLRPAPRLARLPLQAM